MTNDEDKEYIEQLNKAYAESSTQFDKQVLFFASGALGISFAFIKDVVKLNVATHKSLLVWSWGLFVAVIILSVISHYSSLKAAKSKIKNFYATKDKVSDRLNFLTKFLNVLMILFLFAGLVLLTVFVGINV